MKLFEQKIVGMPTVERLGFVRFLIAVSCLLQVFTENASPLTGWSTGIFFPLGVMRFIPQAFLEFIFFSTFGYLVYKSLLIALLISVAIGFMTRAALFASVVLFAGYLGFVKSTQGVLDNGILPLYLLFFLCWLPCDHGFAIDLKRRKMQPDTRPNQVVGWSVFLLRAIVAVSLFQEAFLHLSAMGNDWFLSWNFKHQMIRDVLNSSKGLHDLPLLYMPDRYWSAISILVICVELFFPLVLISWHLRQVFPVLAAITFSLVSVLTQTASPAFYCLFLIFYDWERLLRTWVGLRRDDPFKFSRLWTK